MENSFVQFSYLSGAFDSEHRKNQTLSQNALDMRNQMRNVKKMGAKMLDKAMISSNLNSYSNFFFRTDMILGHTSNIQLVKSSNFDGCDEMKAFEFQKVVRLNDSQLMPHAMNEIVTDSSNPVKSADIT